jgi:hypothetical protein
LRQRSAGSRPHTDDLAFESPGLAVAAATASAIGKCVDITVNVTSERIASGRDSVPASSRRG